MVAFCWSDANHRKCWKFCIRYTATEQRPNWVCFCNYWEWQSIGRIGISKIDYQNKIGEIGYWLAENSQGKGIIHKSIRTIIDFCFTDLKLNRIEIKCATENIQSKNIPEKFNFTKEGVIRQGELLYDKYVDLILYSLLKTDR